MVLISSLLQNQFIQKNCDALKMCKTALKEQIKPSVMIKKTKQAGVTKTSHFI